jgi:hypothetical protein
MGIKAHQNSLIILSKFRPMGISGHEISSEAELFAQHNHRNQLQVSKDTRGYQHQHHKHITNISASFLIMKFPKLSLDILLFFGVSLLVVCGLYPSSTTALPVSSLSQTDIESANLDARHLNHLSFTRTLVKRGSSTEAVLIVVAVIESLLFLALGFCFFRMIRAQRS